MDWEPTPDHEVLDGRSCVEEMDLEPTTNDGVEVDPMDSVMRKFEDLTIDAVEDDRMDWEATPKNKTTVMVTM